MCLFYLKCKKCTGSKVKGTDIYCCFCAKVTLRHMNNRKLRQFIKISMKKIDILKYILGASNFKHLNRPTWSQVLFPSGSM